MRTVAELAAFRVVRDACRYRLLRFVGCRVLLRNRAPHETVPLRIFALDKYVDSAMKTKPLECATGKIADYVDQQLQRDRARQEIILKECYFLLDMNLRQRAGENYRDTARAAWSQAAISLLETIEKELDKSHDEILGIVK